MSLLNSAEFEVYIDGELFETASVQSSKARQCYYTADVEDGSHSVKIVVKNGDFYLDVIEY